MLDGILSFDKLDPPLGAPHVGAPEIVGARTERKRDAVVKVEENMMSWN